MLPEGRRKRSQGALWALLGSHSCRSARGWDLAGNTLGVAGASQMPLWTLLRPRRQPCGRRWCFAEAAVGVAGGSHGPFWASLGRRRGRFDRRWGSQGALLVSFGSRRGRSGRRWGPAGAVADRSQEDEILTFGLNYKPVPQVVVKLDYERWDDDFDRLNLLFGYVF